MARKPAIRSTDRLLASLLALSRAVEDVLEFHGSGRIALGDHVTANKLRALCFLDQQGDQAAARIAELLGVTAGAITPLADSLEAAGLICRLRTRADRRVVFLSLTEQGRQLVDSIRHEQRCILEKARRGLGSAKINQWSATLDQISSVLADAGHTFEDLCLNCEVHVEGDCVLDGGVAECKLRTETPVPSRSKRPAGVTATATATGGGKSRTAAAGGRERKG